MWPVAREFGERKLSDFLVLSLALFGRRDRREFRDSFAHYISFVPTAFVVNTLGISILQSYWPPHQVTCIETLATTEEIAKPGIDRITRIPNCNQLDDRVEDRFSPRIHHLNFSLFDDCLFRPFSQHISFLF